MKRNQLNLAVSLLRGCSACTRCPASFMGEAGVNQKLPGIVPQRHRVI